MKHRRGHFVPLAAIGGEILQGIKDVADHFDSAFSGMAVANVPLPFHLKILVFDITRIGEAIGEKQDGVAGDKLHFQKIVSDLGKKSRWDSGHL